MNAALNGLLVVHWLPAADAAAEAAGADDGAAEAAVDAAGAAEAGAADGAGVDAEPHAARSTVTNPTTNANRALRLAPFTGMPPRLPISRTFRVPCFGALPRRVGTRGPERDPTGTVHPPGDGNVPPGQRDPARGVGWPSVVLSPPRDHRARRRAVGRATGDAPAARNGTCPGVRARPKDSRRRPGGRAVGVGAPRIPVPFRGCSNEPRCLPGRASSPRGCRVHAHSRWRRTSWRARV